MWYKKVTKFRTPRVDVNVLLRTNDLDHRENPKAKVFKKIWCSLVSENLREISYDAQLAQIHYSISPNMHGISFEFLGFNDGLSTFIKKALEESIINGKEFQNLHDEKEAFENKKDLIIKSYKNIIIAEAYRRKMDYLYNILSPRSVDTPTLLAEVEKLTYEDFKDMQKEWLKNVKTDWQVYGHIELEDAVSLVKDCESLIVDQKSEVEDVKSYVILKDRSVSEYFIPHPSDTNKNSTAICYFQGKGSSEDMKAYALNYFLFSTMRHHAFQTLRTQEQLGYIVFCQNVHVNTILGGSILVHSPKKDPDYLVHRINTFLESEKERIQNLSDEDFEKNKKSLITKKKVKDVNLRQATHRDWEEIYDQLYEFSRREKQIEALESITKEELIYYFNEIIFENCRRLNIKVICKAHQENPDLEAREMNQKWYEDQGYTVNQIDPDDIAKFQKEQNFLEVRS